MLENFRNATLQMKDALEKKNTNDVQAIIKKRQHAITRIDKIDRALRTRIPKARGNDIISEKTETNTETVFIENIKQIIDEISEVEKECRDLMKAEQSELKTEILKLKHHRHRTGNYRNGRIAAAKFIDTTIR
jgi:hypothetical protein